MVAASWRESFDTLGEGVAITTGNTALTTISSSGGKVAYAAAAISGARGVRYSGAAVSSWSGYTLSTAQSTLGAECYFKYKTADKPTGSAVTFLQIRNSTGGALSANWLTTGQIYVLNAAGGNLSSNQGKLNSDTELADGNYRLQITAVKGTTTSNGRVLIRLDNLTTGASITALDTGTTENTGTTDYTEIRWGKTGAGGTGTIDVDEQAYVLASTAAIDLSPANQSPTANAGSDQTVEPYFPFLLDFSGSTDPEGQALTYTATQTAGTTTTLSGSGDTRTGTAPATLTGDLLVYSVTANDGTNTSTADEVSIAVLYATETFVVSGGGQTPAQLLAI